MDSLLGVSFKSLFLFNKIMERALKEAIAFSAPYFIVVAAMLLGAGRYSIKNYMDNEATFTEAVGYALKDLSNGIPKIRKGLRYKEPENRPE